MKHQTVENDCVLQFSQLVSKIVTRFLKKYFHHITQKIQLFLFFAVFVELMKNGLELGTDYGRSRQKRDFLKWAKKRRCSISREELIGYICNKTNSTNYHRPSSGKHSGGRQELGSPRISRDESDFNIQPFKEANFQGWCNNQAVELKSAPLQIT